MTLADSIFFAQFYGKKSAHCAHHGRSARSERFLRHCRQVPEATHSLEAGNSCPAYKKMMMLVPLTSSFRMGYTNQGGCIGFPTATTRHLRPLFAFIRLHSPSMVHTFSAQKIGIRPSVTRPLFTCFVRANFNF